MPLNIDIMFNDRQIETLWIGRVEDFAGMDVEHEYIAGVGTKHREPWNVVGYDEERDMVRFRHRYEDGARECVRKALNALHEKEEREKA